MSQMNEQPLTDDEIARIEALNEQYPIGFDINELHRGVRRLVAEVRRLRAENDNRSPVYIASPEDTKDWPSGEIAVWGGVKQYGRALYDTPGDAPAFRVGQRVRVRAERLNIMPSSAGMIFEIEHVWFVDGYCVVDATYNGKRWLSALSASYFEAVD